MKREERTGGGTLIEFAIILPLLVILTLGVLSAGRLLTQVQNANQATYLAASLGAELDETILEAGVRERVRQIIYLHRKRVEDVGDGSINVTVADGDDPEVPNTVTVEVTANLTELLERFQIGSRFTMPRIPLISMPADLETPKNGILYNCNGSACGTGVSCGTTRCP